MHKPSPCQVRLSAAYWPRVRALLTFAAACCCAVAAGCAAMTNPVVDGVPVHRLPPELLAPPKNPSQTIQLTLLEQPRPPVYLLGPGDVLAVYVEGVLGERGMPLPMHVPPAAEIPGQHTVPPGIGYPVPVREDGTIALPFIDPLRVQGSSVAAVQEAITRLYRKQQILVPGKERIFVSLLHPRRYEVLVLRQESTSFLPGTAGLITAGKLGTGHLVELPAYDNDVLHALTLTGGLPGLDAYDEVIIHHKGFRNAQEGALVQKRLESLPPACDPLAALGADGTTVRIPLRLPPGEPLPIGPQDVLLETGDVVFVEARDREVYYTGGLLPSGEFVLPRDHDLDVVQAVAQVRGPLINGAFSTNSLAGNLIQPGIGGPSPTLLVVLRQTPQGGHVPIRVDLGRALRDSRERLLVKAGDVLILQEKPAEALARYLTQTVFNFDLFWQPIHSTFASGFVNVASPDRVTGLATETVTVTPK